MSSRDNHRSSRHDESRSKSRSRSISRSHSRERDGKHSKDKSRRKNTIPESQQLDAKKDYFLKQQEFRVWLKDEKGKFVDEMSGDKSRSYFKKFVKAWNRGELSSNFYSGVDSTSVSASNNTAYKWSFVSNRSKVDKNALEAIRKDVGASTNVRSLVEAERATEAGPSQAPSRPRVAGPTLPSAADRTLYEEERMESDERERKMKRKRERLEDKERIEDLVGPKESGREGALEKKKAKREADAKSRDKDGDIEFGEDVLMGGGSSDSFKAAIARRDAARKRFEEKKRAGRNDAEPRKDERLNSMREKDAQTMAMFTQMAKERFG